MPGLAPLWAAASRDVAEAFGYRQTADPVSGSLDCATYAERGCDPSKVKIFGDGLEKGIVDEVNTFVVETKNAGTGELVTLPLRISIIKLQMFNKRSLTEGEVSQYD